MRLFRYIGRAAGPLLLALVLLAGMVSRRFRLVEAGIAAPFLKGGTTAAEWVTGLLPLGSRGRRRLEFLEQRVAELSVREATVRRLRDENEELRRLLELPPPPEWRRVAAPVIARDPFAWEQRFRIGKGRRDGVVPGAIVLSGPVVVGQVAEAGEGTALVITPADPGFRLSIRVPEAGGVGVVRGGIRSRRQGHPVVLVDYLLRDRSYREGQLVVTSGLSPWVPGGIVVGNLTGLQPGRPTVTVRTLYKQSGVALPGDLSWFRFVVVLVREEGNRKPQAREKRR